MKLIVPIDNLIFDAIIRLGSVTFFPCIAIDEDDYEIDENLTSDEKLNIQEFINVNKEVIKYCAERNIAIAWVDVENFDDNIDRKFFLESKCDIVDRALDYIRINYCRFDLKDTLPGMPGVIGLEKIGILFNTKNWAAEPIIGNKHYFYLQQGLGLEFHLYAPKSENPKLYNVLFSDREDEVYMEFRTILARASQAMHINDINRCFSYLFSTVERMGSRDYKKFEERKKRIIGWISDNQKEYDILSNQFFFFSKVVRTKILHEGKDILEIIPLEKAIEVIESLNLVIYRFASGVIESDIYSFKELDREIESKASRFTDNSLTDRINYDDYESINVTDGNNEVIIIPIDNLQIDSIIKLGKTVIVPRNYNYSLMDEIGLQGEINVELLKEILNDSRIIKLNSEVVIAVFKGNFKREGEWYPDKEMHALDLLCKKVDRAMNYIILTKCNIRNQDRMPAISGIYNRFRNGEVFDINKKVSEGILGRVYKLYNRSDTGLVLEECIPFQEDKLLYNCLYNDRSDEVIANCREALARICESMYLTNYTIALTYLFDIIDMLNPLHTDINKSIKQMLHFVCKSKSEYFTTWNELKGLSKNYRTPMLHHGKNIYEIVSTQEEIYDLFEKIINLIIEYCKEVFSTGITQFIKLEKERMARMEKIGLQ